MNLLQFLLKLLLLESIFEILVMAIFFCNYPIKNILRHLVIAILYSNNPGLCITVLQLMENFYLKNT